MTQNRVLLADDHPSVFEGVRQILEPEFEIVGEVGDGLALLAAAERIRPDIIVADIAMPHLDGIAAVRQIKKIFPEVRVVFLTMHADEIYAAAALKAGGSALVLKSSAGYELLNAIRAAQEGAIFITPAIAKLLPVDAPAER